MYNDEQRQEVVQQNDGDFFSQRQEQTYNSIYSPAMSSSPTPIEQQRQQQPLVIITSPVDCCSRMTTQMKKLESRFNSMENEVSALRQRLFKEETELDELLRSCDPGLTISTIRITWTVILRLFQRSVIRRSPFHSR
jgi:hypothetical protein